MNSIVNFFFARKSPPAPVYLLQSDREQKMDKGQLRTMISATSGSISTRGFSRSYTVSNHGRSASLFVLQRIEIPRMEAHETHILMGLGERIAAHRNRAHDCGVFFLSTSSAVVYLSKADVVESVESHWVLAAHWKVSGEQRNFGPDPASHHFSREPPRRRRGVGSQPNPGFPLHLRLVPALRCA